MSEKLHPEICPCGGKLPGGICVECGAQFKGYNNVVVNKRGKKKNKFDLQLKGSYKIRSLSIYPESRQPYPSYGRWNTARCLKFLSVSRPAFFSFVNNKWIHPAGKENSFIRGINASLLWSSDDVIKLKTILIREKGRGRPYRLKKICTL